MQQIRFLCMVTSNTFFGRLANSASRYFTAIPGFVREENYWFYNISNLAYTLITLLHCSWIVVFMNIGQSAMMLVQFGSIALYISALVLNRRGHHNAAMIIGILEATVHQGIAVRLLGWGAGFQNFIPLIAILPFLKHNASWFLKIGLGVGCTLFYLVIDFFIKNEPPLFQLKQTQVDLFNFSNSVMCFLLAALWGIVLSVSYQRTVAALLKKEQELKAVEQAGILRQLELKERDNEIFQLRNVELKNSNDEILHQKRLIEELVSEQEKIIEIRTKELADANTKLVQANKKLLELIQYNAHNIREPLTRLMGAMLVMEYMTIEEFREEIWPQMEKAVQDLDKAIKEVITIADNTVKLQGGQ